MPHIISAFATGLGMQLDEAFRAVTATPARHMGIRLSYDKNFFSVKEGDFE